MKETHLQKTIDKLLGSLKIVPRTLIATIYGDMLFPYQRPIWLGSLVTLAEPFGVPEYLSRTTSLRMEKMGWLDVVRIGRLSYYSASETFYRTTIEAYEKTYNPPKDDWSGRWSLLLTGAAGLSTKDYTALRRALLWRGAGQISPHVFISADDRFDPVRQLVAEFDLAGKVQLLEAHSRDPATTEVMKAIVADAWDIDAIEKAYENFLAVFRPIWTQLERNPVVEPRQAFLIRTLLVNEHRRIVLRDPRLPKDYLPMMWAGNMVFSLTRNIYQAVLAASEEFLHEVVRTPDGPLPATSEAILSRFGGMTLDV